MEGRARQQLRPWPYCLLAHSPERSQLLFYHQVVSGKFTIAGGQNQEHSVAEACRFDREHLEEVHHHGAADEAG